MTSVARSHLKRNTRKNVERQSHVRDPVSQNVKEIQEFCANLTVLPEHVNSAV
jgi:hypothetical protein